MVKQILRTSLVAAVLLWVVQPAGADQGWSRLELGAKAGMGLTSLGGPEVNDPRFSYENRLTYSAGISLGVRLHTWVAAQLEFGYTSKGPRVYDGDVEFGIYDIGYIEIPILARVILPAGDMFEPYAVLGPAIGIKTKVHLNQVDGTTLDLSDRFYTFDLGAMAGVGVGVHVGSYGTITLDIRYNYGLLNIDKVATDSGHAMNRIAYAMLGYRYGLIGRGKPAKAKDMDMDQDGVPDARDKCPDQAEDIDKFQDDDGCPDPDNDSDEILDADDKCPLEAEDADEFQDEDGCPDPDNDGDGVDDEHDRCQDEMEDKNGYRDDDGCADADDDDDEDGILDAGDKCLGKPGYWTADGCPRAYQSIAVQKAGIVFIGDGGVGFVMKRRKATDTLDPAAHAVLDEIAQALADHPKIARLEIGVHTARGGNSNVKLSQKQAEAVRAYLVAKGVDEARLGATGYGNKKPFVDPDTGKSKAIDRVELTIE